MILSDGGGLVGSMFSKNLMTVSPLHIFPRICPIVKEIRFLCSTKMKAHSSLSSRQWKCYKHNFTFQMVQKDCLYKFKYVCDIFILTLLAALIWGDFPLPLNKPLQQFGNLSPWEKPSRIEQQM